VILPGTGGNGRQALECALHLPIHLEDVGSLPVALLAIGVHILAMLAVTGLMAAVIYKWLGLTSLRRSWINLNLFWTMALIGAGTI
jgi:hypothetical protein